MRTSGWTGVWMVAALSWGVGCGPSPDPKIEALEKRVADLEQELAQARNASPGSHPKETPKAALKTGHAGLPSAVSHASWKSVPIDASAEKGLKWLVSVQGKDGGWGQDGGNEVDARNGVPLESQGNDVANTAIVCLALLRAGHTPKEGVYREALARGIGFILSHVEDSPLDGIAVTKRTGTQIQRKLGPHIDTFLATMVLSEVDGHMADDTSGTRVRKAVEKCVAKVEKNQLKDGSWNYAGGWAPIIGTSIAARGLYNAQQKGVQVGADCLLRVDQYTKDNFDVAKKTFRSGDAAGVELYAAAQALEQASRPALADESVSSYPSQVNGVALPAAARPAAEPKLGLSFSEAETVKKEATAKLADGAFVGGFGSMGGEEFVSYLNISDSLLRAGGAEWMKWNGKIKDHVVKLQNQDGTWAGHHCITGRVACTSAAVMTILAERTAPKLE